MALTRPHYASQFAASSQTFHCSFLSGSTMLKGKTGADHFSEHQGAVIAAESGASSVSQQEQDTSQHVLE